MSGHIISGKKTETVGSPNSSLVGFPQLEGGEYANQINGCLGVLLLLLSSSSLLFAHLKYLFYFISQECWVINSHF